MVVEDVGGPGGRVAEVSGDVGFFDGANFVVVEEEPGGWAFDDGDVVPMVGAAVPTKHFSSAPIKLAKKRQGQGRRAERWAMKRRGRVLTFRYAQR